MFRIFKNKKKLRISFILLLITDLLFLNFGTIIANFLRFEFTINLRFLHIFDLYNLIENIIFVIYELVLKIPYFKIEFTSIKEVLNIFYALLLTKITYFLILNFFKIKIYFSRGAFLTSFLISFLIISGFRIFYRLLYEYNKNKNNIYISRKRKKILIVGANETGEKLLREINLHPELNYEMIGFIDEDPYKKGTLIHGHKVLGNINELPSIIEKYKIQILIYSMPSINTEQIQKILSLINNYNVEFKKIPPFWEIISGKFKIEDIKNVELEDLLPRVSIKLDLSKVEEYIKGKTVLITGAGGSIGSEISRQVVSFNPDRIILLGRGENRIFDIERELIEKKKFNNVVPIICDIRNKFKVFKIFEIYRPNVIFHTAAHKHVPLMEKNPDEAILNNIFGTLNLLDASITFDADRFVNISTDKAVNPISFMGASKRISELLVKLYAIDSNKTKFANVRFGNVLGSKGSVVDVFKYQIKETGLLTITDPKMERYFMLISEAVQLVLIAGSICNKGEIFVLKIGDPINIFELAKQFIKLSGKEIEKQVKIKIIGNRGGEKIKEELWNKNETVEITENPYIFKIDTIYQINKEGFFKNLELLKEAAESYDIDKMKKIIKILVPESEIS